MYAKLILQNAKKSVKDYIIYIVTMTICVTLFYSFLSITSNYYKPDIGTQYDFTMMSKVMKITICSVTLLIIFLIKFVNNYMIKCRQKEFAVQSVMGMEQRTIAAIFFAETFIMGLISIIIGIVLGTVTSQFVTATLMTSYGKSFKLTWTLFPDTVLLTICFFVFSFVLIGLSNTNEIKKTKIIDMLSSDKTNEISVNKSRYIYNIAIIFKLFTIWTLLTGIQKMYFYYDNRFANSNKLIFFANIIFPLLTIIWILYHIITKKYNSNLIFGLTLFAFTNCIVTIQFPKLTLYYFVKLGVGTINQYLIFTIGNLIFFVFFFIYLISVFIIKLKEKYPKYKYNNENLFFLGQITSKLNTTSKTMSLICITLSISIILFICSPILINWSTGYLEMRSVYDIQIYSRYNNIYDEKDLPVNQNYEIITELIKKHNIKTKYDCTFNLYLPQKSDFHKRVKYDFPVVAIALSDYNTILKMLGYETISLNENEFTTQWYPTATEEDKNNFLKTHKTILTDAGELKLSKNPHYEKSIGETIYNSYTDVVYIFPDEVCKNLLPVMKNRYITTKEDISFKQAIEIENAFIAQYPEKSDKNTGAYYGIRLSTLQVDSHKAEKFVVQSTMIYCAIVLMIVCFTILSLQQILDANKFKYRFCVLRNLGVDENRINKLVLKQLSVWFGLPITISIILSFIAVLTFTNVVSDKISAYVNLNTIILQICITIITITVLLICYFISALLSFKRIIK